MGVLSVRRAVRANRDRRLSLSAVHRHRELALSTFRAFVEGTSDEQVRNAVLLAATGAAFSPRPTGYDGAEGDGAGSSIAIEAVSRALPRLMNSPGSTAHS